MALEIVVVPDLGGVESVEVLEFNCKPGDNVASEDALLVLESDKATMEVPSPLSGVFKRYLVAEGDQVKLGDQLAELEVVSESEAVAQPISDSLVSIAPEEKPFADVVEIAPVLAEEILLVVPDTGSDVPLDVVEVLLKVGDEVSEGDAVLVLESDKASVDVPATASGLVREVLVSEADKVNTGDQVARIAVPSNVSDAAPTDDANPDASTSLVVPADAVLPAEGSESSEPLVAPAVAPSVAPLVASGEPMVEAMSPQTVQLDVYAGPAVRLAARELGVDLIEVKGTGPRGRISRDDLNKFVVVRLSEATRAPENAVGIPTVPEVDFSKFGGVEKTKMTKIQSLTAVNMQRSWLNVPHVTHFDEADITDLEAFRKSMRDQADLRGLKLTPVAFIVKAVARSLELNPVFNRSLGNDGKHFVQKFYIHIGVAVDTPKGLLVPVVKDVDQKGLWQIAKELGELASRAREGSLSAADMQGGCFTVSSLGNLGGNGFTPIVNTPEAGILGVSKAQIKPHWNGQEFKPRLLLPLALSYDHRVVNGADSGRFMVDLVSLLGDLRSFIMH